MILGGAVASGMFEKGKSSSSSKGRGGKKDRSPYLPKGKGKKGKAGAKRIVHRTETLNVYRLAGHSLPTLW